MGRNIEAKSLFNKDLKESEEHCRERLHCLKNTQTVISGLLVEMCILKVTKGPLRK